MTMIQSAIQILERAVKFIRDLPKAYKRAPEPLKRQILAIVFKDLIVRDGKLYKAVLNAPLDYLCKEFVQNKNISVIFDGEAFGDPKASEHELFEKSQYANAFHDSVEYGSPSIFRPAAFTTESCRDVLRRRTIHSNH